MSSIGPSSYLPGDIINPVASACDKHPNRFAVKSIVGETDSMGSEVTQVCQECLDEYIAARKKQRENSDPENFYDCEGCGVRDKTVKPARDPEEGLAGPVYYWCAECRKDIFSRWSD